MLIDFDLYLLFFMSLIAFFLFAIDKHLSFYGARRISESVLITVSALFGAFGALVAMILFNHLTDKSPFKIGVPVLACVFVLIDVLYRMFI
ncbi:MAG: DUF1294 domain-containing protein [Muribaculum sp.]|nr:DUF1294 domain-containing protein [Muribaculum sp.]